jgi:hypothetical protein
VRIVVHHKKKPLDKELATFLLTTVYLDISKQRPELVNFSVSQLMDSNGIRPVIRFDCSHGFLNVHRYYRSLHDRTDYPDEKPSAELYEQCKKEIYQNWKKYRELFLRRQNEKENV